MTSAVWLNGIPITAPRDWIDTCYGPCRHQEEPTSSCCATVAPSRHLSALNTAGIEGERSLNHGLHRNSIQHIVHMLYKLRKYPPTPAWRVRLASPHRSSSDESSDGRVEGAGEDISTTERCITSTPLKRQRKPSAGKRWVVLGPTRLIVTLHWTKGYP